MMLYDIFYENGTIHRNRELLEPYGSLEHRQLVHNLLVGAYAININGDGHRLEYDVEKREWNPTRRYLPSDTSRVLLAELKRAESLAARQESHAMTLETDPVEHLYPEGHPLRSTQTPDEWRKLASQTAIVIAYLKHRLEDSKSSDIKHERVQEGEDKT